MEFENNDRPNGERAIELGLRAAIVLFMFNTLESKGLNEKQGSNWLLIELVPIANVVPTLQKATRSQR